MASLLPRKSAKSLGLNESAIIKLVDELERNGVNSYIIAHNGEVVSEGYWDPFVPDLTHQVNSVTKTYASLAIGIAADEGLLTIDDYVLSFFPDRLPAGPCDNMKKLKIRHLLTMTVGHDEQIEMYWTVSKLLPEDRNNGKDFLQHFLTSYIAYEPGTKFLYNTPGSYMLGAILKQVTGKTLVEYLQPRLFEPLGMKNIYAETDANGLNASGWGFQLTTEDLAKLGLLLLNKGKWNGKQLVSEKYIEQATSKQTETNLSPPSQWGVGYGFQLWRCNDGKSFRADGLYGQFSVVTPHLNSVVAVTSASDNTGAILDAILSSVNELFGEKSKGSLGVDKLQVSSLEEKNKSLQIKLTKGQPLSSYSIQSKEKYRLANNPLGLSSFTLDLAASKLIVGRKGKEAVITIGEGKWIRNKNGEDLIGRADFFGDTAATGAIVDGQVLIQVAHLKTNYTDTLKFKTNGYNLVGNLKRVAWVSPVDFELIGVRID
ncbi:beta-lactamase family protein [Sugiyamaella lignohabitans]|uniref:Beta-lactamase family protein n=1 Tax=Sugiyamaella lignohabitans TaxID=796027 RepID=A0A167F4T1_9ASCO|nr:beta-lactamase family protein [Sugiyamaella lignohabitans]ANB14826.1 beta-lactamase family protein [Sugiyamaella lignohabitans]